MESLNAFQTFKLSVELSFILSTLFSTYKVVGAGRGDRNSQKMTIQPDIFESMEDSKQNKLGSWMRPNAKMLPTP